MNIVYFTQCKTETFAANDRKILFVVCGKTIVTSPRTFSYVEAKFNRFKLLKKGIQNNIFFKYVTKVQ